MKIYKPTDFPKKSNDDPAFSLDVICVDSEGMLNIGCYHFGDEKWLFHTDTLVDPYEFGDVYDFVWMYKPKKLVVG